jgi:transcriptional regulator with XRE-family HTH domain
LSKGIKSLGIVPSNLRAVRAYRNLQAKEVAAKLDVHVNTLYFWEKGTHEPKVTDIRLLAVIYGVEPESLVGTKLRLG